MLLGKGGVRVMVMGHVSGGNGNGNGGETGKMRIKGEHRGGGVHARRERKENSENVQEFPLNRSHTGYFCFLIEGGEFFLFFKQFHCFRMTESQ